MLYKSNQDLPVEIRTRLSEAYQDIYRAAYNSAIHWYGEATKAHQVALSAVKMQSAMHKSSVV
ncbi:cation transport regulator ChaB [Fischerella thermalis CCMEE 5268]|jgi:cation transport regulator|uniref:Cation transport regulator ChaB n=2 Tax=Fischerella thermalis TaxID=372787 RepID=A0A2N6LEY0_9CYAN|nr:ChaB family protein [Fischerella thermalis]PMB25438.1 cation transport regulator ChaB [Fischerella thermalis CCMEE 5319]PMB46711.1 cation transport regulator ChaB [Fischerella thermalis CCMEE 5201]PMB49016.1 cation transport regulator ChaB [Fischerella thermalis CCMEE 5205]PLZ98675.1 cation transport regulator ChaB [Fischerella thermalis CCMEE 5268]PMB22096.1 cation transport regulator ChaB [Fischerella thermalis CCMEE 5318]